jgi:iron complex outermembrane receptor protein
MKRFYKLMILPLFLLSIPSIGLSQVKLSGTITDQSGNALSEANILLKNTYLVTSSDNKGRFVFDGLKPGNYQLQVSYVGFETLLVPVNLLRDTFVFLRMQINFYYHLIYVIH